MKLTRWVTRLNNLFQNRFSQISHKSPRAFKFSKVLTRSFPQAPTSRTTQLQILKIDIQILESDLNQQYQLLGKYFYTKLHKKSLSSPQTKLKTIENKIKTLLIKLNKKKQQLQILQESLTPTSELSLPPKSTPKKSAVKPTFKKATPKKRSTPSNKKKRLSSSKN